jgi:hypothetical protein
MAFHRWNSLWEETDQGEVVAADTARVAQAISALARENGITLRFRENELYRELTHYVWLRLRGFGPDEIRGQRGRWPTDWDDTKERIWIDWIRSYAAPATVWPRMVWDVAFGRNETALWEDACCGWREDVVAMFPYWVVRDPARLYAIDPTPMEIASYADEIRAAMEASDANIERRLK